MSKLFIAVTLVSIFMATTAEAQSDTLRHHGYPERGAPTGWVLSRYDQPADRTVLELKHLTLDSTLSLTALVALEGQQVRKEAPGVVLTVWSTGPRGRLAGDPRLALDLDGRQVPLPKLWIPASTREGYTEAGLGHMNLNTWLALASARSAAVEVGPTRYPLPEEFLKGVRELAARMRPVAAR